MSSLGPDKGEDGGSVPPSVMVIVTGDRDGTKGSTKDAGASRSQERRGRVSPWSLRQTQPQSLLVEPWGPA